MDPPADRQRRVAAALATVALPPGVTLRAWAEEDFPAIQRLSDAAGWPTPRERPGEALAAWQHSWPALVALDGAAVIGFLRALSYGTVTTYVAEILGGAARAGRRPRPAGHLPRPLPAHPARSPLHGGSRPLP